MTYGKDPADALSGEVLKLLLPGNMAEIKLLDENLPIIKADLETAGCPKQIKRAQISIRSVTFVDGSQWSGGSILYPDPKNPKRKLNLP